MIGWCDIFEFEKVNCELVLLRCYVAREDVPFWYRPHPLCEVGGETPMLLFVFGIHICIMTCTHTHMKKLIVTMISSYVSFIVDERSVFPPYSMSFGL